MSSQKGIGNTFWIIMTIVVIVAVVLLAYAFSQKSAQPKIEVVPAVYNPEAGLGEEGAACGGEMSLPCKPGLACLGSETSEATGVCTRVTDGDPGKIEPPGVNN